MPIKDIDVPAKVKKPKAASMPVKTMTDECIIEDADGSKRKAQLLTEFNLAKAAQKDAENRVKQFRPLVEDVVVKEWLRANVNNAGNGDVITSIKFTDANGSELRVTGMNKYSAAAVEPVEALFEDLDQNVNDFVQFTLEGHFDSTAFIDEAGSFDEARYKAFKTAIDKVATELGIPSPLTAVKVLKPKDEFHNVRWAKFNLAQQIKIFKAMPNQITLTPLETKLPVVDPEDPDAVPPEHPHSLDVD